ncbi:MAG: hypothetical protein IRY91_09125 [Gemmatimonadaceae bacterium]|nr:hypothetical protein [Gemmatimonadaceae bacterium]
MLASPVSRVHSRSATLLLVVTAAGLLSCSSGTTPHTPAPPAPMRDSAAVSTPESWTPRLAPGSWHYHVVTEASVALTTDSSTTRVPVRTSTFYTIRLESDSAGLALRGSVDSATVSADKTIPEQPDTTQRTSTFTAHIGADGAVTDLQGSDSTQCVQGLDPRVAAVRALLIHTPATLTPNATWSDSTSVVTCRGTTPIRTTTTYTYEVKGLTSWQGTPALEIARTGTITLASEAGLATASAITITGTGNSTTTLLVDPATAMILHATGESHASLTVATARSKLPFRQDVTETITLQP